jgi:hypothetical protein
VRRLAAIEGRATCCELTKRNKQNETKKFGRSHLMSKDKGRKGVSLRFRDHADMEVPGSQHLLDIAEDEDTEEQ